MPPEGKDVAVGVSVQKVGITVGLDDGASVELTVGVAVFVAPGVGELDGVRVDVTVLVAVPVGWGEGIAVADAVRVAVA